MNDPDVVRRSDDDCGVHSEGEGFGEMIECNNFAKMHLSCTSPRQYGYCTVRHVLTQPYNPLIYRALPGS